MKPEIRMPTPKEKETAQSWPVWEKEPSSFPWEYSAKETCLILEGNVTVTNEQGEQFHFGAGAYVIFPKGMKCRWHIKKAVRKHYAFDQC
ncbi:cupin domain-containing protein [bacterium]|nr:cupin domain-containing protein [bacterium]MCP5461662.1 cupin domain-containing protein [bacterium]